MADVFGDAAERNALVNNAAAELGVAPWVVEKDLWVCWLLARLHEVEGLPQVTFKGGTSLSKVHRLVSRFSEDIDLTFSREGWGFDGERDPLHEGLSGKKQAALVDAVVARSVQTVRDLVLPGLEAACREALGSTGWSLLVDEDDPQSVTFAYPSPATAYSYGHPVVRAEFGARGDPWPTARRVVQPYLEDLYAGTAPSAVVEVTTLEPERTFWEKATLLHALHHGTLAKPDRRVDRLSRHLYDLHQMWAVPDLRSRVLAAPSLLQAVTRNKAVFFKDGKARYDLLRAYVLDATPHDDLEQRLRADYAAMSSMFFPDANVPGFDELLVSVREIDAAVRGWSKG